jgi:DNA-binding transcriptional LysR family regulator
MVDITLMRWEHQPMMELRRLAHLIALAEERHFARAAERVHLSQPAFSRSIQVLERDVGMRLFDRNTGEVLPTAAGLFLIERARQLLFDARCFERDVQLYGDAALGDLAFGAGPIPAATLMPQVLAAVRQRHPQVQLRLQVANWRVLLEHMRAETIEFFIADVRDLPAGLALDVHPLGRQPGGFYVRAGHPLAGQVCTLDQAWRYGVATTRLPPVVTSAIGQLLGLPAGAAPTLALECDDVGLLQGLALASDTVLAVTDAAVRADVQSGRLLRLQVQGLPSLFVEMGVISLSKRSPSPMALQVIALAIQVAGQFNEGAPPNAA